MDAAETLSADAEESIPAGPTDDGAQGPSRRCIVSREVLQKECLIRFAISPGDEIVPDIEGKLPGRGLWVKAERSAVEAAAAKNLFGKAARQAVEVPADLADRTTDLLRRRCLNLIGLARRSGQAVCGFERVRADLSRQNVGVLLEAADGAETGQRKLKGLACGLPTVTLFANADLSAVFGRENVVHAALAPGRFAELLIAESGRLSGMRRTCE